MAGIRDEVELDVTAALRSVEQIGASLNQQVDQFQVKLATAMDQLRAGPQIDTSALEQAAQAATTGLNESANAASNLVTTVGQIAPVAQTAAEGVLSIKTSALAAKSGISDIFADIAALKAQAAGLQSGTKAAAGAEGELADGAAAVGGGMSALATGGLLAVGLGLSLVTNKLAENKKELEEQRAAIAAVAKDYLNMKVSVAETTTQLETSILVGKQQLDDLRALGLNLDQVTASFHNNAQAQNELQAAFDKGGISSGDIKLAQSLKESYDESQKGAKAAIDQLVALGKISDGDAQKITKAFTVDGVTDFVGALTEVRSGLEETTTSTDKWKSSVELLDEALKAMKDNLDGLVGKFTDSEDATASLDDAIHSLGEAFGEGRKKGEPLIDFQNRLKDGARDVVTAAEDQALAMAKAGQIGSDQASINGQIAGSLKAVAEQYPELKAQLQGYIDKLVGVPSIVVTKVSLNIADAEAQLAKLVNDLNNLGNRAAAQNAGREAAINNNVAGGIKVGNAGTGQDIANQVAAGLKDHVQVVADAGRQVGQAAGAAAAKSAKEAASSVLKSAADGFDIGGFLVSGIILDPAQKQAQDLNNFFRGMVQGIGTTVADAIKIDPSEQANILDAVEKVAQDTIALGKAREELGADSIEAAIAERQLSADQANINKVILEATDSTEAYTAAMKKLSDGVDAVTGSFNALKAARDAANDVKDAEEKAQQEQERLALLDRTIAEREAQIPNVTDPTQGRRLQETIDNLKRQRDDQAKAVEDSQFDLVGSQLKLVDSQQKIVDAGNLADQSKGQWEEYFRTLATSAGLSQAAVDQLVASLDKAASTTSAIKGGVLGGNPQGSITNPVLGDAFSAGAPAAPNYYITIQESVSPRATAQELVNETRAVALTAG